MFRKIATVNHTGLCDCSQCRANTRRRAGEGQMAGTRPGGWLPTPYLPWPRRAASGRWMCFFYAHSCGGRMTLSPILTRWPQDQPLQSTSKTAFSIKTGIVEHCKVPAQGPETVCSAQSRLYHTHEYTFPGRPQKGPSTVLYGGIGHERLSRPARTTGVLKQSILCPSLLSEARPIWSGTVYQQ